MATTIHNVKGLEMTPGGIVPSTAASKSPMGVFQPGDEKNPTRIVGNQNNIPYTVIRPRERVFILILVATSMLASPLTATMYLPLLPVLSDHFHVSSQSINLTITVYIVFQAISPVLLSSVSDQFGRRPIYLASFSLFALSSLGLALNRSSYGALLGLRATQSLGASAVLSLSYGTLADITVSAERGKFLGPMLAVSNLGTCVGPIIGGWIALASGNFFWAFWALFVFATVELLALVFFLPETARNVVGNGSIEDSRWNWPFWRLLRSHWQFHKQRGHRSTSVSERERSSSAAPKRALRFSSPLAALRVIFYKDSCLNLWLSASFYALWYCVQATIPSTFKSPPYSFSELEVGLAYLPGSAGVIISMYVTGKAIDRNYRRTARGMGFTVDKVKGDDLTNFPIERARSWGCDYLLLVSLCATIGYGWSIARHAPVAIPLILQCPMGFVATYIIQCYSTLMVDIFPNAPSTASTATNMTRCVLSAIAVAIIQPLDDVMGKGWLFTILGVLTGAGGFAAHCLLRWRGMEWRNARNTKTRTLHSNV